VREVLSELDLDFISRPCARGSDNREKARALGGRVQFPLLVDADAGVTLYESEDIIDHLYTRYGAGRAVWARPISPLNTLDSALASAVRPRGRVARVPARVQPPQLLELWNFEVSPYCRKVREALHELNLDARIHNVAKRSVKRPELVARGGKMQVPYLADPNTGTEMYESDDIVAYLQRTYG
jgi:glutathione S-transferase